MKRKQLAKRVAIAVLSAATVMTAAPVGAFAATNVVSVDASDAGTYGSQSIADPAFEAAFKTALASVSYPDETTSYAKDLSIWDDIAVDTTGKKVTNFKVVGRTDPDFSLKADGTGNVVMPVVTVQGDVVDSADSTKGYGKVTFTVDATALEKSEQITLAKKILSTVGGTDADPNVTSADNKYVNGDNDTSVKTKVLNILKPYKSSLTAIVKSEALATGVTVSQTSITQATKTAAGSETIGVNFKLELTAPTTGGGAATNDGNDPAYDATKSSDVKQYATGDGSYTATIKKLDITSEDSSYQEKVEAALANTKFTNQVFNDGKTDADNWAAASGAGHTSKAADAIVTKALDSVGLKESKAGDYSITYRSLKTASHKENGSVQVIVDQKRDVTDDTKNHEYAIVTVPVVHSTVDIANEVSAKVQTLAKGYVKDAKSLTPTAATKKEQIAEIEQKITSDLNTALEDKLNGTQTIASEVKDVKVKIANDSNFQETTFSTPGFIKKVEVEVTFNDALPDGTIDNIGLTTTGTPSLYAENITNAKKLTFVYQQSNVTNGLGQITLYKLGKVAATSIALDDEYVIPYSTTAADEKATITPNFTPKGANKYTIRWSLSGDDAAKFDLYDGNNELESPYTIADKGVTVKAKSAVDAGTEVTLKAELIDEDNLVAQTATTTVKVVKGFSDVQNTHSYEYRPVTYLSRKTPVLVNGEFSEVAVIEGVGNNRFNPTGNVTRGQFVTFLYRLAQEQASTTAVTSQNTTADQRNAYNLGTEANPEGKTNRIANFTDAKAQTKFTDVAKDAYYAKAVDWAVTNGITNGTSDTTFEPNKTVTRAEAVTFLQRYFAAGQQYNASSKFDDVKSTDWFAGAVGWAVANGVTQGKDESTFAPSDTTTRAEAAAFIYRALDSSSQINK